MELGTGRGVPKRHTLGTKHRNHNISPGRFWLEKSFVFVVPIPYYCRWCFLDIGLPPKYYYSYSYLHKLLAVFINLDFVSFEDFSNEIINAVKEMSFFLLSSTYQLPSPSSRQLCTIPKLCACSLTIKTVCDEFLHIFRFRILCHFCLFVDKI